MNKCRHKGGGLITFRKVMSQTTKLVVVAALSFFCGAGAMKLLSLWQLKTATSCEDLLNRENIPNPFHISGDSCAVMDVSKGYRAQGPTDFPPESIVWRGRPVKVLGRKGRLAVVQDCQGCKASWLGLDANRRSVVKMAPEVP